MMKKENCGTPLLSKDYQKRTLKLGNVKVLGEAVKVLNAKLQELKKPPTF